MYPVRGVFNVTLRAATEHNNITVSLAVVKEEYASQCGTTVSETFNSGAIAITNNGWQSYSNYIVSAVSLSEGRHKIRVKYDNDYSKSELS